MMRERGIIALAEENEDEEDAFSAVASKKFIHVSNWLGLCYLYFKSALILKEFLNSHHISSFT